MATIPAENENSNPNSVASEGLDRWGWGFAALLLVIAALFVRPADLIPQLRDVQVYQLLVLIAIGLSYNGILEQLSQRKLPDRPVTACLILLIFAVAASHLVHGLLWEARESALTVAKLFALYLLIVSVINSTERLELFALWLLFAITSMSTLAVADKLNWIEIAAFAPLEESYIGFESEDQVLSRIRGSGIFEDPNDLGLVLVTGIILCAYFFLKPDQGWPRYVWLVPGAILIYTLTQTHSRGAFIALATSIPACFFFYRGWRFALAASVPVLPVVALFFAGRMTDISSVYEGTGQSRIQIWAENLSLIRRFPFFGIGEGMAVEEIGIVTHNSFLQSYAELGLPGGSLFLAAFLAAIVGLIPGREEFTSNNRRQRRLHAAIFAVTTAYCVGILTLSRQFVAPTFMILGLATATQTTSPISLPYAMKFGNVLFIRSIVAGVFLLGSVYVITRFLNFSQ